MDNWHSFTLWLCRNLTLLYHCKEALPNSLWIYISYSGLLLPVWLKRSESYITSYTSLIWGLTSLMNSIWSAQRVVSHPYSWSAVGSSLIRQLFVRKQSHETSTRTKNILACAIFDEIHWVRFNFLNFLNGLPIEARTAGSNGVCQALSSPCSG